MWTQAAIMSGKLLRERGRKELCYNAGEIYSLVANSAQRNRNIATVAFIFLVSESAGISAFGKEERRKERTLLSEDAFGLFQNMAPRRLDVPRAEWSGPCSLPSGTHRAGGWGCG